MDTTSKHTEPKDYDALAVNAALRALNEARNKHPNWPSDPVYMLSIVAEEAGEAVQAANDLVMHPADTDLQRKALKIELAQTAAVAIRALSFILQAENL